MERKKKKEEKEKKRGFTIILLPSPKKKYLTATAFVVGEMPGLKRIDHFTVPSNSNLMIKDLMEFVADCQTTAMLDKKDVGITADYRLNGNVDNNPHLIIKDLLKQPDDLTHIVVTSSRNQANKLLLWLGWEEGLGNKTVAIVRFKPDRKKPAQVKLY